MERSDHSDMFIMHPPGSAGDVLAAKIATEIEKEFDEEVWYGIETTDREIRIVVQILNLNVTRYLSFSPQFVETNADYSVIVEIQIKGMIKGFREDLGRGRPA